MSTDSNERERSIGEMEEGEIVESFRGYVETIVDNVWNGVACHGLAKDDLRSSGYQGLLEAYRNYDPERETTFSTFAYSRVRGAMIDEMRRFRRAPRGRSTRERDNVGPRRANKTSRSFRESADEVSLRGDAASDPKEATLCTYLMSPSDMERLEFGCDGGQQESVEGRDNLEALREAMEQLSEFERTIIRLYDIEGCTMADVAEEMDCSKSWAARIRQRAHGEMKEYLEEHWEGKSADVVPFERAG